MEFQSHGNGLALKALQQVRGPRCNHFWPVGEGCPFSFVRANEGRKLLCCSSGHASPPIGHESMGQGHRILRWAKALEGAGEAAGPEYSLINARPRQMRSCVDKHQVLRDRNS